VEFCCFPFVARTTASLRHVTWLLAHWTAPTEPHEIVAFRAACKLFYPTLFTSTPSRFYSPLSLHFFPFSVLALSKCGYCGIAKDPAYEFGASRQLVGSLVIAVEDKDNGAGG
jgi:hypothetical protein